MAKLSTGHGVLVRFYLTAARKALDFTTQIHDYRGNLRTGVHLGRIHQKNSGIFFLGAAENNFLPGIRITGLDWIESHITLEDKSSGT